MKTYANPVYRRYFADPFVLEHVGVYYAYGTAPPPQRAIPALVSTNLVRWRALGDVLELAGAPLRHCWAPEVAHRDGSFYMY